MQRADPRPEPRPGLRFSHSMPVDESLTVPAVSRRFTGFADMPPVFATAFMVGFMEWTCIEALRPYLAPGEHTVGTHVDMSHIAATPAGFTVTAEVELVAVEGRKLRFRVALRDECEPIGEGFHERAIIRTESFMRRVAAKRSAA
jgi:fluoroacetyl-CoA thioesterase